MSRFHHPPPAGAFTLLEVMISVALLAIGLVGLMGLLGRSLEIQSYAAELRIDAEMAGELTALDEITDSRAREESLQDILERYPTRTFERVVESTPHFGVSQVHIQIYRDGNRDSPSYTLSRFVGLEAK